MNESVLEEPESIALEGLWMVRSSKAAPGYFNPTGGPPVLVPGLNWLTVMFSGMHGPPALAAMDWWTSRGKLASDRTTQKTSLLAQCAGRWRQRVLHVFDRESRRTLAQGVERIPLRLVMSWPTRYQLTDALGSRTGRQVTRGKRFQDHRLIWGLHQREFRKNGILVVQVCHPQVGNGLWQVVSRPGKGRRPWYY